MAVITISREFANKGDLITEELAKLTGWPVVDKDMLSNLLSEYGMVGFEDFYDAGHGFFDRFSQSNSAYIDMLNKAIKAYAKLDNVIILGRGGFAVLQGYSNVLNVLVKAPREARLAYLMESEELNAEAADAVLTQNDKARETFLHVYYGLHYGDTSMFDLMLDSSLLSVEMAAQFIADAAHYLDANSPAHGNSTRLIEGNNVLDEAVRDVMVDRILDPNEPLVNTDV